MNSSGTHFDALSGHSASLAAIAGGTSASARQCAPALHAGKVDGSITGGPSCGQVAGPGPPPPPSPPALPPSHVKEILHAPVSVLSSGLVHGAQRSSTAHTSCGKRSRYCATCGMQPERQTPSAPASDWQAFGV